LDRGKNFKEGTVITTTTTQMQLMQTCVFYSTINRYAS